MSSEDNTSTLQSYVDSAKGAAQGAASYITGSSGDQAKSQQYHDKADAERDISKAGTNIAGYDIGATGIAKQSDDRTQGQWDQTIGSAKETIGNVVGSQDWKQSGREQNLSGQSQEAKGQLSDASQGIYDRVSGHVGAAGAAILGDREKESQFQQQHDTGKASLRGVQSEIEKENPPRQN